MVHNQSEMAELAKHRILDTLSCSIICVDETLCINYINSPAEILFGHSASSLMGIAFTQLFSRVEPSTITDKLPDLAAQGQVMTEHDATLTLASGKSINADYTIYPLEDAEDAGNIMIEIRPVNRQALYLRDKLSQIQNQTSQLFARGMAHEIRNPLGGIRGAAQLLEREIDQAPLKDYTDVIISEVDRLQALISKMLGPSTALARIPINVHEVLEHIHYLLITAEPDRFKIQRDYDPSIPELLADRDQLIQALLNIAQNAVQAIELTGTIIFRTRIGRQFTIGQTTHPLVVLIKIIDTGKGIPPGLSDSIFLPMVTDKPQGSGLGLPIAQEIISSHGGIISAENNDEGTTLSIVLPLETA